MGAQPIRILVVEDSPAQRALIVAMLNSSGDFTVVGTADNGGAAVSAAMLLRPAIVAMDVHLPVMDGYEATRQIMQRCPTPIVMFSNSSGDAERRSVQALAAGALAVVRKPSSLLSEAGAEEGAAFLKMLRLMSGVRVVTRHATRAVTPQLGRPTSGPVALNVTPELLAVAASTGGPAALQTLLVGLGPVFPLPVLIVQHIARGFTSALVDWIASVVPLPVQIIAGETRLQPGHAYFAPDDTHLVVSGRGIAGTRPCKSTDRYTPSADMLFESAASIYGPRAIGVIMTGMGDDGARGLASMHAAGAATLAQDEASCVVYGMPQAAVAAGAVGWVMPLIGLGPAVQSLVASVALARGAKTDS